MMQQVIPQGYLITDFGDVSIEVQGQASGGQGAVVWGPNNARGGEWEAVKMVRPDRASPIARTAFEQEAIAWLRLWP
nr:hypothetical protein [Parachlamydiaceae bacterium]